MVEVKGKQVEELASGHITKLNRTECHITVVTVNTLLAVVKIALIS